MFFFLKNAKSSIEQEWRKDGVNSSYFKLYCNVIVSTMIMVVYRRHLQQYFCYILMDLLFVKELWEPEENQQSAA